MTLDYSGLTEQQIEDFVRSVNIEVEVDATFTYAPTNSGKLLEGEIKDSTSTGWLTGYVLDLELQENLGDHHEDVVRNALDSYKEANGVMKDAQKLFLVKYPMLAEMNEED